MVGLEGSLKILVVAIGLRSLVVELIIVLELLVVVE